MFTSLGDRQMWAAHLDQLRVLRSDLPCRTSLLGCCVLVYDYE